MGTVLALTLSGCLTGTLIESGRLHERVDRYERVGIAGSDLVVDYTVVISRSAAETGSTPERTAKRSVMLSLDDLDARPTHPTDAFPLRRAPSRPGIVTPLALKVTTGDHGDGSTTTRRRLGIGPDALDPPRVEITERLGRHLGFRLCSDEADRGVTRVSAIESADRCLGYFYSAALYDDHLAWWIYPLAPFAVAIDVALLPIQAVTLPPLLLLSD